MDDAAPAAAMAMVIFFTAALIRNLYNILTQSFLARAQSWRRK